MRVAARLAGAFALLIVLLVLLVTYHLGVIRDAVSASYELSDIASRFYLSSTEQVERLDQLEEHAVKFDVTRDGRYLDRFQRALEQQDSTLAYFETLSLAERERTALADLRAEWGAFRVAARRRAASAAPDSLRAVRAQLDVLREHVQAVARASRATMGERMERSAAAARVAERLSWGAAAAALLLSVIVSALIVRSIARSLAHLRNGTDQVAGGNFAHRLDDAGRDEFAQVASAFNAMTRRLGELEQVKRDFLSKVSHDLKTPLASMQETTRLLLDGVPGAVAAKQRRLLELNLQTGRRLSAMIAKLLDLARLEAGASRPDLRTHAFARLVRQGVERLAVAARERACVITVDVRDHGVLVECDADHVLQVLDNLLENAVKFSPEGGTVHVAVEYCARRPVDVPPHLWDALRPSHDGSGPAGAARLTVADAGPGVPDDDHDRIFERFYQAPAGRAVRGRGVGLGLAICREIVTAHGGAIWVSERPEGGSRFDVLWPGASLVPGGPEAAVAVAAHAD